MRLLTTFLYYVRWQRVMAWTTGIGVFLMLLGLLLPERASMVSILFGSGLAVGFPITFAGVAFRELISNRRFVLVPGLRAFAAMGLLLLAVVGSAVSLFFAGAISPDVPIADPVSWLLLAFTAISVYLLMSQWIVTHALGLFGFVFLPLVGIRFAISDAPSVDVVFGSPWLLAAVALLGWAWLIVAMRKPAVPMPMAASLWGQSSAPDLKEGHGQQQWLPQLGPVVSSTGTLMRGMRDGLRNRITFLVMAMLTIPVTMWLILFLLGDSFADMRNGPFSAGFYLVWSLFGLALQAATVIREWPARLRYLWLRIGGDRRTAWNLIERSLLADIILIGCLASLGAIVFGLLTEIEGDYLVLYVVACVVITWFASYTGFWTRAANWHELVHALIVLLIALVCFATLAFINESERPDRLYWLLSLLAVLTIVARMLAKRRVIAIDWCSVRPVKLKRTSS